MERVVALGAGMNPEMQAWAEESFLKPGKRHKKKARSETMTKVDIRELVAALQSIQNHSRPVIRNEISSCIKFLEAHL